MAILILYSSKVETKTFKSSIIKSKPIANTLNKSTDTLVVSSNPITNNLIKQGEKVAYLTFDDGPSQNTSKVLKVLKANAVNATFFVNGHPEYEAVYKEIINQGNVIGNHTYSHNYKADYSSITSYNKDVDKLNSYLEGIGISTPTLMRFPGGSNNTISNNYGGKNIMKQLIKEETEKGYQYIDWNVYSGDSDKTPASKTAIINNVMRGAKGKKSIVILLHDSKSKATTAEALPLIIKNLKEQGYEFKTLSINSPVIHFK